MPNLLALPNAFIARKQTVIHSKHRIFAINTTKCTLFLTSLILSTLSYSGAESSKNIKFLKIVSTFSVYIGHATERSSTGIKQVEFIDYQLEVKGKYNKQSHLKNLNAYINKLYNNPSITSLISKEKEYITAHEYITGKKYLPWRNN